jgi:formylglycine-generating enzyme required for sulfatase activity
MIPHREYFGHLLESQPAGHRGEHAARLCIPQTPVSGAPRWGSTYAASIPGVHPTSCVTWFQAQQACGNSGKRLPSNAEWQLAVAGSPDPGGDNGTTDCNTASALDTVDTGSRSSCKSYWGAYDMVGNVWELVADWVPRSAQCGSWGGSDDYQCLAGVLTVGEPGALYRGGGSANGALAGPLAVGGSFQLSDSFNVVGFRCAR